MRLMVQSLLADRFGLVARHETKQVPVFALTLAKPGRMGPQLRAHPADAPCSTTIPSGGEPFLKQQLTADIRDFAVLF